METKANANQIYDDQFFEGNPIQRLQRVTSVKSLSPTAKFLYENKHQLQALEFFWIERVEFKDVLTYFSRIAELYELFLAPQLSHSPPHQQDCSFLKKFKTYSGDREYRVGLLNHVFKILSLNSNEELLVKYDQVYIMKVNIDVVSLFHENLPLNITNLIRDFLDSQKRTLIFPLSSVALDGSRGHAHVVSFTKDSTKRDIVHLLLIDPQGTPEYHWNDSVYIRQHNIISSFRAFFGETFGIVLTEVLHSCPVLQTIPQGGSCGQWQILFFVLLLKNPHYLEDNSSLQILLKALKQQATINIHLFSLSIFLRTMPYVHLKTYCEGISAACPQLLETPEEDNVTRKHVTKTMHFPDCYSESEATCPPTCVPCSGSCNFKSAVRAPYSSGGTCKRLSTKNIAKKMFFLYSSIRKMTGQDPLSMTLSDIYDELGENPDKPQLKPQCR